MMDGPIVISVTCKSCDVGFFRHFSQLKHVSIMPANKPKTQTVFQNANSSNSLSANEIRQTTIIPVTIVAIKNDNSCDILELSRNSLMIM